MEQLWHGSVKGSTARIKAAVVQMVSAIHFRDRLSDALPVCGAVCMEPHCSRMITCKYTELVSRNGDPAPPLRAMAPCLQQLQGR